MPRHSKRNTASASFTYAERVMLTDLWGSKKARVAAHSMRAFDMCCLCLDTARNPVACGEGHLFCKECILNSLLQQSKDITAQKTYLAQLDAEEEAARERAREQARSRILRQFEAEQSGVRRREEGAGGSFSNERIIEGERERRERAEARRKEDVAESSRREDELALTLKRKASNDAEGSSGREGASSSTVSHLSSLPDVIDNKLRQAEATALAEIEAEQRDARRSKLPAFWLPSLTPSEVEGRPKDIKLHTVCRAGDEKGHKLKMKNLIDVKFTRLKPEEASAESPTGAEKSETICPSCKKGLGSASKVFVLKPAFPSKSSADKASKSTDPLGCPACDKPLASSTSLDQAVLALDREGTGYAAGGAAEVKKQGTAFQG
ncbi:hypothetical protein OC844_005960 [Tilletia horrida]|nr:hypothetical protein OC844_005960 [Tilletia horrida]